MKSNSKSAEQFNRLFCLQSSVVVCLFTWMITNAATASNVGPEKQTASNPKSSAANKELCQFITDSQGKKFVQAKMGSVTYKVPDEFIGGSTCNSGKIFLGIRWPSLRGFKTLAPGGGDVDAYRVILSPPRTPPAADSYVTQSRIHKFDARKNPSEYPGLFYLNKNGKQLPILVSGEKWPKTPSGNPYVFSVGVPANIFFHTNLVLPSGSSMLINDGHIHKYMNEWDRLFPAFIGLIKSFELKE